ncbi:MAG: hypothetical protein ABEJ95_03685 [Candidatus Nanohalobium sp.]
MALYDDAVKSLRKHTECLRESDKSAEKLKQEARKALEDAAVE